MQILLRQCYIVIQEVAALKFAETVLVELTGDLDCSLWTWRYCSFVAKWQCSMSQDQMLHQGTVALLLPFWETLQVVTKELVSGKRRSVKQRSDRQWKKNSKDNESERKQTWQLEATRFRAYLTSAVGVCRNGVGENRHAGGTHLEVNLAFEAQNWIAGDICQNSLCLMWVLLMNWRVYYVLYWKRKSPEFIKVMYRFALL